MDAFLQAWVSGDAKEVEKILTRSVAEDSRLNTIYEVIIYNRNKTMASRIEDFLKIRETHFVIVGAGHLVGERGIIEILKKKGYQVDQM